MGHTPPAGRDQELVLLGDFGSTFSKFTLIARQPARLLGHCVLPTTRATSIVTGYRAAKAQLLGQLGVNEADVHLAEAFSSSAWGGFKLVVIGRTQTLTQTAARQAALGSGTRIIGCYAYTLSEDDMRAITALHPDAILLAGGTDGGDQTFVVRAAEKLAVGLREDCAVIYAGNRQARPAIRRLFRQTACPLYLTENVMPKVNVLALAGVKRVAATIFTEKIVHARGLDQLARHSTQPIIPTPVAVQSATQLFAKHQENHGVLTLDVGGATTDVHSYGRGLPTIPNCLYEGLPEPLLKRTVEGDLGMRESAMGIVEQYPPTALLAHLGPTWCAARLLDRVHYRERHHTYVSEAPAEVALDQALALKAVDIALDRHLGRLVKRDSQTWIQTGKNARHFGHVIVTGGALLQLVPPRALYRILTKDTPDHSRPQAPQLLYDQDYLLAALGLLAQMDSTAAYALMRTHLKPWTP